MKAIAAGEFKNVRLKALDDVASTNTSVVITNAVGPSPGSFRTSRSRTNAALLVAW